jgi:imidazolonepropionase-like amidohydrolase
MIRFSSWKRFAVFCLLWALWPVTSSAAPSSKTLVLKGGTFWTITGKVLKNGMLLIKNGRIVAVGQKLAIPKGAKVLNTRGMHITPGWIDTHSHMGVYPVPHVSAHSDGNEATRKTTPYVWVEHSVWPQDPAFARALQGGTTTVQILPGSANLIGGRSVVVKLLPRRSVLAMKFPGAPHGLKMACGENPKRVYRRRGLQTRMGSMAGYRAAFQKAVEYKRRWDRYARRLKKWKAKECRKQAKKAAKARKLRKAKARPTTRPSGKKTTIVAAKATRAGTKAAKKPVSKHICKVTKKPPFSPPSFSLGMDTLKRVIENRILVHIHCYRADEMIWMMKLAKDFGFRIRSFHHATSAYKIRDLLTKANIGASIWADWWGFKMEAYDAIQENAAMMHSAGGRAIIHSDSSIGVQRMHIEAAKAYYRGKAMGLKISVHEAMKWITINPAWALGIDKLVGSLDAGKMADIAVWNRHPFSVYARTRWVIVNGKVAYDRKKGVRKSDFELGQNLGAGGAR